MKRKRDTTGDKAAFTFASSAAHSKRTIEVSTYIGAPERRYLVRGEIDLGPPLVLYPVEVREISGRMVHRPQRDHVIKTRGSIASLSEAEEALKSWAQRVVDLVDMPPVIIRRSSWKQAIAAVLVGGAVGFVGAPKALEARGYLIGWLAGTGTKVAESLAKKTPGEPTAPGSSTQHHGKTADPKNPPYPPRWPFDYRPLDEQSKDYDKLGPIGQRCEMNGIDYRFNYTGYEVRRSYRCSTE